MEEAGSPDEVNANVNWKGRLALKPSPHSTLLNELGRIVSAGQHGSRPIADLYSESTIMFADIVGFTQWASCRVPTDAFTLLESIFASFDEIANHRRVYKVSFYMGLLRQRVIATICRIDSRPFHLCSKVETVGDCYVAACGVPKPRKDHALVMARFARDCVMAFNAVVKHLESELGPDTGDLGIRVGVHSEPVTAGVLRGERSRFQLFGGELVAFCDFLHAAAHSIELARRSRFSRNRCLKHNLLETRHDEHVLPNRVHGGEEQDPHVSRNHLRNGPRERSLVSQARGVGHCQGQRSPQHVLARSEGRCDAVN